MKSSQRTELTYYGDLLGEIKGRIRVAQRLFRKSVEWLKAA
jgi:hypothetical protein